MDGIDLANMLHREHQLPIVFLTANADDDTFNRAKAAKPFAFLPKPFRKTELKRTLELAVSRMELAASAEKSLPDSSEAEEKDAFLLRDRIFLRFKDRMVKILYTDILYVAADRSYCKVVSTDKEYLLTMPMKKFEEMLPIEMFQRTHRSYLVNVQRVDEVVETHILVGEHELPLSSGFREAFMGRLNAG
jgi:DNA-binding LytR/AlgR family response regulator